MTTALTQIQEEITKLEERLKLLRAAEAALQALEVKAEKDPPVSYHLAGGFPLETPHQFENDKPSRSLAATIRELLTGVGPLTKAGIDRYLTDNGLNLGKGSVSGALQAMKARGVVARTKTGKWTVK